MSKIDHGIALDDACRFVADGHDTRVMNLARAYMDLSSQIEKLLEEAGSTKESCLKYFDRNEKEKQNLRLHAESLEAIKEDFKKQNAELFAKLEEWQLRAVNEQDRREEIEAALDAERAAFRLSQGLLKERTSALDVATRALEIYRTKYSYHFGPLEKQYETQGAFSVVDQALSIPAIAKRQKELDAMEKICALARNLRASRYPERTGIPEIRDALAELDAVRGE